MNLKASHQCRFSLGIYLDFNNWKDYPLIMVSNKDLRSRLGVSGKYAAFSDLVDLSGTGSYKISDEVNEAYAKSPGDRNRLDKEIMKVDERLNIVYMIYKGDFLKLFPLKDGTNDWGSSEIALQRAISKEDSLYLKGIIPVLTEALKKETWLNQTGMPDNQGVSDHFFRV